MTSMNVQGIGRMPFPLNPVIRDQNPKKPVHKDLFFDAQYTCHQSIYEISQLNLLLARNDFESIIHDKDLFWLTFCKVIASGKETNQNKIVLDATEENNHLYIAGNNHYETLRLQIENLRVILADSLQNPFVNIVALQRSSDSYCLFIKDMDVVDVDNYDYSSFLNTHIYDKTFKPFLVQFFQTLGTQSKISSKPIKQKRRNPRDNRSEIVNCNVFNITWNPLNYLIYPIPPKPLADFKPINLSLYSMYQQKELCDFNFETKGNVTIPVHLNILYALGGEYFKRMVTSKMQEFQKRSLFIPYEQSTVCVFLDFVYMGLEEFKNKWKPKFDQINWVELFELANSYQNPILIDFCANFISTQVNSLNLENMQMLADSFENEHLKKVCEHIRQKDKDKKALIIPV